jgi:toxin ParE1/3/4
VAAFEVFLTHGAERDLAEIYRYVASTDSAERADRLLDRVIEAAARLASLPERGPIPRELQSLGIRDYRQLVVERTASSTA